MEEGWARTRLGKWDTAWDGPWTDEVTGEVAWISTMRWMGDGTKHGDGCMLGCACAWGVGHRGSMVGLGACHEVQWGVMWTDEGMGEMQYDGLGHGQTHGYGLRWLGQCQPGQSRTMGESAWAWTDSMVWADDGS